jgi:hypothetical protein
MVGFGKAWHGEVRRCGVRPGEVGLGLVRSGFSGEKFLWGSAW